MHDAASGARKKKGFKAAAADKIVPADAVDGKALGYMGEKVGADAQIGEVVSGNRVGFHKRAPLRNAVQVKTYTDIVFMVADIRQKRQSRAVLKKIRCTNHPKRCYTEI